MEKIVKHFVEKTYPGIILEGESSEVAERDPRQFEGDENLVRIRFYDQEVIVDGEMKYYGEEENVSNYIYFGRRMTLDDVVREHGNEPEARGLIETMKNRGYESVCFLRIGSYLPMFEDSITYDEFLEQEKSTSL